MTEEIVKRIEQVIDHYGLSVSAFADELGVQRSSISHLLNGRNKPSLDFVLKLITAYPEVGLDWLLKGEGNFPPSRSTPDEAAPEEREQNTVPRTKIENMASPPNPTETVQHKMAHQIAVFYTDGTFELFSPKKD